MSSRWTKQFPKVLGTNLFIWATTIFGLSCDYTKSATESAKIVVAQINKFVPRTLGNCFIHIDDIDYIILEDTPIPEIPAPVV